MVAPGTGPSPPVITRVGMPSVCESTAVKYRTARMSVLHLLGAVGQHHVAAYPPDVQAGVQLSRVEVALGDRLVDHPVLGDVDLHAPRLGQRVVAEPAPQRLVHDLGD